MNLHMNTLLTNEYNNTCFQEIWKAKKAEVHAPIHVIVVWAAKEGHQSKQDSTYKERAWKFWSGGGFSHSADSSVYVSV